MQSQDKPLEPISSLGDENTLPAKRPDKTGPKLVLVLIGGLTVLAVLMGTISFLVKNTFNVQTGEIEQVEQEIGNSLNSISDNNDFKEDLDVKFNQEQTGQLNPVVDTQVIDSSISDIDNILKDLNKTDDFNDFGKINYTQ